MLATKNKGPRACTTCAKAKSRCVPGPMADICERCHRLKKPCGLQTPAPPRRRRTDNSPGSSGLGADQRPLSATQSINEPGHQQQSAKLPQRTSAKSTRVSELERRLEDLTTLLHTVNQQQKAQLEIRPPESSDPNHGASPLDAFRLKPHWSYMYPARHIFPESDTGVNRVAAPGDEQPAQFTGAFGLPRDSYTQNSTDFSPPITAVSPVSNINANTATVNSASSISSKSVSTAPTSGADMETQDLGHSSLFPSFHTTGKRSYLGEASAAAAAVEAEAQAKKRACKEAPAAEAPTGFPLPPLKGMWPQAEEAEVMLSEFRRCMMPVFPFVIIPEYITAEQLRCNRPILWKAIMMATCHLDGRRQILMGNQLVNEVVAAAFLQPRRSLDILQAVLVLVGWFHYNINSFQLLNFFYLARALCVSLGISEPTPPLSAQREDGECKSKRSRKRRGDGGSEEDVVADGDSDGDNDNGGCHILRQTTEYSADALERMRTFAGTFYLVSLATTTNKRPDTMMSTPYLDTCCQVLERQMEYPSDAYLLQLVRIQQLNQSISVAYSLRSDGMELGVPRRHIFQDLRQQIVAFKAQLPEQYNNDVNLTGHIQTAEVLLYDAAIQENSHTLRIDPMSNEELLKILWACTHSIREFMRNRFKGAISDQPRHLCLSSFDFIFTFLTALKLMTMQVPGWDCRRVRTELAFDEMVDRQILDLQMLAERRNMSQARYTGNGNENENGNTDENANATGNANGSHTNSPNSFGQDGAAGPDGSNPSKIFPTDPFSRLATRLAHLKLMISTELDKLPSNGLGGSNGSNGSNYDAYKEGGQTGPDTGHDASPFMMLEASMASSSAPSVVVPAPVPVSVPAQHHDPYAAPTTMASIPDRSAPGHTATTADINTMPAPGVPADMSFQPISLNVEPILSYADATMNYMQNLDGPGFVDLYNAPVWDSYMDADMDAPSYYESWGQMNLS